MPHRDRRPNAPPRRGTTRGGARPRTLVRSWSRLGRGDRGDSPIELAIMAMPLIIVTVMVVHAAAYFYARSVALGAATAGANAARSYDTTERNTGRARAQDFLDDIGRPGLSNVRITQQTTTTTVTVTVRGTMVTLIPGVTLTVSQSARRPIERFTR